MRGRKHPFADLIGFHITEQRDGYAASAIDVTDIHINVNGVVHGAVVYAMADTTMGATLHQGMADDEICATIEIKINYYKPVFGGKLTCESTLINRGKRIANVEASVYNDGTLVSKANGNFAIFKPGKKAMPAA